MNTFPTLSASPRIDSWVEDYSDEAVSRASFASGYPCLNEQFTFDPMTWKYVLENVSQTDKDTLMTFYQANRGKEFYWLNEQDDTVYEVLFLSQPSRALQHDDDKELWRISMTLRQSSPTELPVEAITHRYYGGDAMIEVENLAAGADITLRPAWVASDDITIISVRLLSKGTPSGIDNSNTVVLTLKDDSGNTLLTKTYNTATQPPTNDAEDLSSLLDNDYVELDAGDHLTLTVTQGTTANMPAFALAIGGYFR